MRIAKVVITDVNEDGPVGKFKRPRHNKGRGRRRRLILPPSRRHDVRARGESFIFGDRATDQAPVHRKGMVIAVELDGRGPTATINRWGLVSADTVPTTS